MAENFGALISEIEKLENSVLANNLKELENTLAGINDNPFLVRPKKDGIFNMSQLEYNDKGGKYFTGARGESHWRNLPQILKCKHGGLS